MNRINICNLSFSKSSIHPSFSHREMTKLFQHNDFNSLFYNDFKYNVLVLTNLFISLKDTERKGVYKILFFSFYGTDVSQQIWLCSLFLSVDYYFPIDFDFKTRDLNS